MSEPEVQRQLREAVDDHPAHMTADGAAAMEELLERAGERVAAEPERVEEARRNIERFLDHAAAASEEATDEEADGDVLTLDRAEIDAGAIQLALRDMCPFFPIC